MHAGMKRMWILLCVGLVAHVSKARQGPWDISILARGNYISSSKIFSHPDATTDALRGQYIHVENMLGGGLEVRYRIPGEKMFLTLSLDYVTKARDENQLIADDRNVLRLVPATEGMKFIPVEFGVHTYVPIGSDVVRLTMGGGAGSYYAWRTLTIAGVGVSLSSTPVGYGIHIETGVEYKVASDMSIRMEMKFRDPEIVNEGVYERPTANYNGSTIPFPQDPFRTKIQVDGLSLSLGIMVELF